MKIYRNITETIGSTPLVHLAKTEELISAQGTILAKIERGNPGGSIKDRAAKHMLEKALKTGEIDKNTTIIEPTSGNTGIGLAAICAFMGIKLILTMPATMSIERQKLLKAYGASLVLTEGAKGMAGAIEKAQELLKETKNSYMPMQFENKYNAEAHYLTTGPEIWADTDGKIDILAVCVGTGGTLTGVGKYLKEKNKDIKIVAIEPAKSPLLSGGKAGAHGIQGIGANFVPKILDTDLIDEVICVSDENAVSSAKAAAVQEGLLVGISSGAALWAAKELALRSENKGKVIVTVLPDTGERYISTVLFDD